jgi:hypothetical protein
MTPEQRKARHPHASGTKEKVIADLTRYVENPDKPMVREGLLVALKNSQNMNVTPAKMFEDGGHKINAIQVMAARCGVVHPPKDPADVFQSLEDFFAFCGENQVPVTLGGFAIWNGVTQTMIGKIERDTRHPERAEAFAKAKECIRTFLEISAYDGTLNPILWFHTNKVSFGAVENQQVTVHVEDNTSEMTPAEYAERVVMLTQGEDGIYRE